MRYPVTRVVGGATPLMYACQQCRESDVLDILRKYPHSVKERDRTLKTPLHYCAENPNNTCAEAILKMAPELVNSQDDNGYCPLHLAVIAGNKPLIKLLIAKGADVNLYDNEGHSAIHWAIVSSEKEALQMIIQAGADPSTPDVHGGYPLHYAVQMCGSNNDLDLKNLGEAVKVVQTLLRYGVDVNVMDKDGRQPILWAASAGSSKAITHLINSGARVEAADKDGLTALHCAASRGHTDTIQTLVTDCGTEVDIIDGNGCSALFYAVTLGHADSTAVLLNLGAQPNRQDRKGRTPAHCGAAKGQLETLKILQNHGGNLWLRNVKGDFPFHEAIASGRKELVLWFLQQNPDAINIGNNDGRCAIHIAAMYNDANMIKVLLESKSLVNPVMRSSKGILMTPLNVALCKGHRSSGKLLQLHGGVPFSKVSKSNSDFSHSIRSPGNILNEHSEWIEELVSPSFTIIKTSQNDNDEYMSVQSGEKKKVYRRRKKRKNNFDGKKLDSDSEDSVYEEKKQLRKTSRNLNNNNNFGVEDADESKSLENEPLRMRRNDRNDAITSIIMIDGGSYPEKKGIESTAESESRQDALGSKETKYPPLNASSKEPKNLSSLSPEDFPPTMQIINHLDYEITEAEIDGTKTPNEMEKENRKLTLDVKSIISDTGESKESNVSEAADETEKSSSRKEIEEESKTSDLLSPSFTVLKDGNNIGKATRSGPVSSDDTMSESKSETSKEISVHKIEKTTKTIHSKSSTVRKYEKTTTKGTAKRDARPKEDEKSSGSGRDDKNAKMTKSKNFGDEKMNNKNSKKKEETIENGENEVVQKEVAESNEKKITEESVAPPAVESLRKEEEEEKEKEKIVPTQASEATSLVSEARASSKKTSDDEPESQKLSEDSREETVTEKVDSKPEEEIAKSAGESQNNSDDFIVTSDSVLPDHEHSGHEEVMPKANATADEIEKELGANESLKNEKHKDASVDNEKSQTNGVTVETLGVPELPEVAKDSNENVEPVGIAETENLTTEPEKPVSNDRIQTVAEEEVTVEEKANAETNPTLEESASVPEVVPSEQENASEMNAAISDFQSVIPVDMAMDTLTYTKSTNHVEEDERNNNGGLGSELLALNPNASESSSPSTLKPDKKYAKRNSDHYIRTHDEKSDENDEPSREELKQNEANEVTTPSDSDELTHANSKSDNNWMAKEEKVTRGPKVSRLCRRNKDLRAVNQISVNQLVQGTIRKYHLERGIFHQLLELKRLQIRAGRANEQVLVKRLADEYERSCASLGMRHYTGTYKFKEFERFLYEQLKTLNRSHSLIPEIKSYDDIDALSGILKKSRFKILSEVPPYEPQCSCITQRCHHTTRAYTSIPCSAYVASLRRNPKSHKSKKGSFLPQIEQFQPYRYAREKFLDTSPTTLELIQGNTKQVIELPPTHPDKSKKYYITFTIKSAQNHRADEDNEDTDYVDDRKDYFKHRHAKSV